MLTLVLSVILSIVVLGLANFTATGLRTSIVSTERTERSAAATAGLYYSIEQLAQTNPITCPATFSLPAAATPGPVPVTMTCTPEAGDQSPAVYWVTAHTTDGHVAGRVTATIAVRVEMNTPRSTRVIDWNND